MTSHETKAGSSAARGAAMVPAAEDDGPGEERDDRREPAGAASMGVARERGRPRS